MHLIKTVACGVGKMFRLAIDGQRCFSSFEFRVLQSNGVRKNVIQYIFVYLFRLLLKPIVLVILFEEKFGINTQTIRIF